MEVKFPIYRKYKDLDVWFKIESKKAFKEIKKTGETYVLTEVQAEKYPEILFISDMIECLDGRWEECSMSEFEKAMAKTI